MKKIQITRYVSVDGREFESEDECLAAEEELRKAEEKKKVVLEISELAGRLLPSYKWYQTSIPFSDGNPLFIRKTKSKNSNKSYLMIASLREDFDEYRPGKTYVPVISTRQDGEFGSRFWDETDEYFFQIIDKWKDEIQKISDMEKEKEKERILNKIAELKVKRAAIDADIAKLERAL